MREAWIGAGGWGYFRGGPTGRPLPDYARAFRFVEVNVTFYRHPSILDARRWRRSVPPEFEFSVKGHRTITHGAGFQATRSSLFALARDLAIARALRTDIIILEIPPDRKFGREEVRAFRDLAAVEPRTRIGLEARAYAGRPLPAALASALRDAGGIDVVDLSKGHEPRVASDVLYTRLLGRGASNAWELSDDELREVSVAAMRPDAGRTVFAFHGVRMYKDAARFLTFERTGRFPPATRRVGIEAVREALEPDARFPATREDLIQDQGWKVIATERRGNVHAGELLERLPSRAYTSLPEVIAALRRPGRGWGGGRRAVMTRTLGPE